MVIVVVFTKSNCMHCVTLKNALQDLEGVDVKYVALDEHGPPMKWLFDELTGGAKTVPQVFVGDEFVPGGASVVCPMLQDGRFADIINAQPLGSRVWERVKSLDF